MSKEVLLIFQDCPYCKPREEWGKRQMELAKEHSIVVRETKYNFPGAGDLIKKAQNHGLSTLPFFTDGKTFSYDLSSFIQKQVPRPKPEEEMEPAKGEVVTTAAKRVSRKKVAEKAEIEDGASTED